MFLGKFGWVAFFLRVALGYIQLVAGHDWKSPGAFTPPSGSLHMGSYPLVTKPELLSNMVADCPQRAQKQKLPDLLKFGLELAQFWYHCCVFYCPKQVTGQPRFKGMATNFTFCGRSIPIREGRTDGAIFGDHLPS